MQPIFMLSADFPTLSAPSSPSCVVDVISPTTYCGPAPPRPLAPLSGADSPYQGEMSRRDKRGRDAVSRRLTERSSQICCNLSVPAFRRATSPERGGFFAHPINFFVKIPQKSYPILATGGNVWYGYGTTPKSQKRVPAFSSAENCR